jgi:hypothetical protein
MAKTRTAARMVRLVAQWRRRGGESAASFARRHRVSPWAFWYWQRKLSARPVPETPTPATFVPVQVAVDEAPVIELVFSSGERLQVRAGASADLVRATVSALRSAC